MLKAKSTDLSAVARFLAIAGGSPVQASVLAESTKAPEAVRIVLRAAVDAGSLADPAFAAALADNDIVGAFVEAIRPESVFARMLLDGGLARMPLRTSAAVVAADATAYVVGEGMPIPISAMALSGRMLEQQKAAGMVVVTNEVVRSVSPAARSLLDGSLKAAVSFALDAKFIDLITDGITPLPASGVTAAAALSDLRELLDIVNINAGGSLYWVMPAGVANAAATLASPYGELAFPAMSPVGGEILNLPALVSDAVPSDRVLLIDASGIGGEIEAVTVEASGEASIQMDSAPNSPPNAATVMRSLWQENKIAILGRAAFGAEPLRDNAVAILSDIAWSA